MQREIALLQGIESGVFSVAMGAFAAELSGTRAVAELARRRPALRCRSTLRSWRDVAELVRTRSVDLGMADPSALGTVAGLALDPVGAHALVLFCRRGHPLSAREGVSIADLEPFPLACIRVPPEAGGLLPGRAQQDEASGDLIPHIEVDDVATAPAIVLASDAFSVATPLQIAPWLASGELWALPFQPPWLKLDYGFIRLEHRTLSPAASASSRSHGRSRRMSPWVTGHCWRASSRPPLHDRLPASQASASRHPAEPRAAPRSAKASTRGVEPALGLQAPESRGLELINRLMMC